MTIETSFALVIVYAVALVQASRRSILSTRQILGPWQLAAGVLCAALVPTLAVYTLQFHTGWALGLDPSSSVAVAFSTHGFVLSIAAAVALFLTAALAYYLSARLTLTGRRLAGLAPVALAVALLLAFLLRGSVGGRFSGDGPPPAIVATIAIIVFLVAALIAVGRLDGER